MKKTCDVKSDMWNEERKEDGDKLCLIYWCMYKTWCWTTDYRNRRLHKEKREREIATDRQILIRHGHFRGYQSNRGQELGHGDWPTLTQTGRSTLLWPLSPQAIIKCCEIQGVSHSATSSRVSTHTHPVNVLVKTHTKTHFQK